MTHTEIEPAAAIEAALMQLRSNLASCLRQAVETPNMATWYNGMAQAYEAAVFEVARVAAVVSSSPATPEGGRIDDHPFMLGMNGQGNCEQCGGRYGEHAAEWVPGSGLFGDDALHFAISLAELDKADGRPYTSVNPDALIAALRELLTFRAAASPAVSLPGEEAEVSERLGYLRGFHDARAERDLLKARIDAALALCNNIHPEAARGCHILADDVQAALSLARPIPGEQPGGQER